MSVLVRRFGRLWAAYPVLLRLGDTGNHPHRVLGALPKRRRSTPSAACDPGRSQGFAVPAVPVDENNVGPKRIRENTYAHNLFLNLSTYANTVMRPSTTYAYVTNEEALEILRQDWSSMTSAETVLAVKKLSYNIRHNDEERIDPLKYTNALNALDTRKLTDDELMTMMRHLVPFGSHMKKDCDPYSNLCERIDRECMMRFLQLKNAEKTLYLCDMIYQMTRTFNQSSSQYVWYSIRNLGNKPHKLSPQQLIQILFLLNIYRKPPINMYEFEYQLERCADELSINELAIGALGFFKTSTKIRSTDFLSYIIRRTIAEIDVVHTVSIAAIVKLVRYSMQLTEVKSLKELMRALTPHEPRYTLMTLAHIAQACGRVALYNEELMDRIIKRLNKELKIARLKDLERFIYTFSIFNIASSNSVYQNVIENLRATWNTTRAHEIAQFPQVATCILGYMTTQNVYPIDLIKYVMAPEYVNKTCNGNYHYLSREYCVLDYSLRIEVPEYDGPFLKPVIRTFLEKKYHDFSLKTGSAESTRANLLLSSVLETCQELFNTTDVSTVRALPHYTPQDIIFCLDERNQLVPSEKYLSQFESSEIKRVDKENSNNVRWIALVMGHHGLLIRNCHQLLTGSLAAKLRQLSIIGYTPIMISYISWEACKSPQEKRDYIKRLISS